MRNYIVFVFFLSSFNCFSQQIDYLISDESCDKVQRITNKITDNLQSDREKVIAIHSWITHNIKYDVKKLLGHDASRVPTKKILKTKEAICLGYADLFNEMCKSAGVISTSVPGYVKSIETDLGDGCYYDDHVWNAVFFDDKWHLLDVGWDAGYIEYFRKSLIGRVVYLFTLGHFTQLKYSPHFVTAPDSFYFCPPAEKFLVDHLPADSIWQLMPLAKTVEEFENDSAFYYKRFNLKGDEAVNPYRNNIRIKVYNNSPEQREVSDGYSIYDYNNKNQFSIAKSHLIKAKNKLMAMEVPGKDTALVLRHYKDIKDDLKTVKIYGDSCMFFFNQQRNERHANNSLKKNKMLSQNKPLITSTTKAYKTISTTKDVCKKAKVKCKKQYKTDNGKFNKVRNNEGFLKAKKSKSANLTDSLSLANEIASFQDSISILKKHLNEEIRKMDSTFAYYNKKFLSYCIKSQKNRNTENSIIEIRFYYFDDLDYEIRVPKDTLMSHKFDDDSLLYNEKSVFIVKDYFSKLIDFNRNTSSLHMYYKLISNDLTRLKKSTVNENNIEERYYKNLEKYEEDLGYYDNWILSNILKFKIFRKIAAQQIRKTKKELKAYKKEQKIELGLFKVRGKKINIDYLVKSIMVKNLKSAVKNIEGPVIKTINGYSGE